jgi:hypothetical protein
MTCTVCDIEFINNDTKLYSACCKKNVCILCLRDWYQKLLNTSCLFCKKVDIGLDDFKNKQQFEVDEDNFTYTQIPFMVSPADYRFKNTGQYDAVINKLCLQYAADSISPSKANVKKAICNASIDWGFHAIDNYSYLGVMPLVVDNRLVLSADEFLKDGKVAKVYMTTAEERRSTEESFNLMEYKIIK